MTSERKPVITTPGFERIWEASNRVCDLNGIPPIKPKKGSNDPA